MTRDLATVIRADARDLPLPDASVDLIMTSPPYFGLRSYTDGGEHYDGQIGSEETPRQWLEALWACTAEWVRVLKPGGSIFVNLGDKYSGAQQQTHGRQQLEASSDYWRRTDPARTGIPAKSLMGLPWRYALGCVDDLGLILRAEIVWAKPNGLPESVTDRVRRSHEQVFHFTKQPRYYAAVDEIREAYSDNPRAAWNRANGFAQNTVQASDAHNSTTRSRGTDGRRIAYENPLGKLPGSVWEIPSQPLTVPAHLGIDHFAAFPMELPRRIILGWSPPGICVACGEGRRPVTVTGEPIRNRPPTTTIALGAPEQRMSDRSRLGFTVPRQVTGYACACPDATAPTRPALVVDPFAGTGTTMLVASAYGRIGIGADLSMDYCRLARWRTRDPAERAKALQVPKPPPVPDGQGDLFAEVL